MFFARSNERWSMKLLALLVACSTPVLAVTPSKSVTTLLEASRACTGDLCRFENMRKALAVDPHSAEALRALGDYYYSREQYIAARAQYAAAVAEDSTDWRARKQLAELNIKDGNTELALAEFRKLEKENPTNVDLESDLAASYERLGRV